MYDRTKCSIAVTLWKTQAENYDVDKNDLILIKKETLNEFKGRSINVQSQNHIMINPKKGFNKDYDS